MPSRVASILAIGVSLALVTGHAQESERPLTLTRPTIGAAMADGRQFFHDLIFEDNVYRIVEVSLTWFWVKHDDLRTAFTGAGPRVR